MVYTHIDLGNYITRSSSILLPFYVTITPLTFDNWRYTKTATICRLQLLFLLFLLLRWHYTPIRTFCQSALFVDLSFQFLILHLLYLFVHSSTVFFCRPPSRLPWWLLLNTWLTLLSLSILLTRPIQFNRLILTNGSISKSPNSCFNSSLYRFLQFVFTFNSLQQPS